MERIGTHCFQNCRALSRIVFESESKLSVVDQGAFDYCSSLESICLPSALEHRPTHWFRGCKKLWRVAFAGGAVASENLPLDKVM
jgi:hypothetical protein